MPPSDSVGTARDRARIADRLADSDPETTGGSMRISDLRPGDRFLDKGDEPSTVVARLDNDQVYHVYESDARHGVSPLRILYPQPDYEVADIPGEPQRGTLEALVEAPPSTTIIVNNYYRDYVVN